MTPSTDRANELPCVWVLAGVLSYRLCDRGYDCDHCELFHALRGGEELPEAVAVAVGETRPPDDGPDALVEAVLAEFTEGCTLHLDRPYSPGHFWVQVDEEDRSAATVGLDDYALRVLQPVDDVVVPRAGVWLTRGEPCGWVARGHSAVPLTAPLSGEITKVNASWLASVHRHRRGAGADGWLLRLRTHEDPDDVPDLFRGEETLRWYLRRLQMLRHHLRAAASPAEAAVGVALPDGGTPPVDLEQILGPERFAALVHELFGHQI